ncbi:MAG TPA: prepilin-type N-terminal cleavage/methylation domain-containing protein [Planctomycetota bacterium]|nr:prepilin-type N-terminal cleavage/methylation domain-containing protein [Planctomycetota bacterium]
MVRGGFTLLELLVVICILSILIALSVVSVGAVLDASKRNATESLLHNLSAAATTYSVKWGTFPPTSLAEIGGTAPNDLNNGVETLAACLSSRQRGGPCFQNEEVMSNVDEDHVDRNLTDWYWGTNDLFEYHDAFGHVIIYFNAKDYAKPRKDIARYRFSSDGAEVEVAPELHPVLKSFVGAGRFQLRSVGKDGKPGTDDDIRPE